MRRLFAAILLAVGFVAGTAADTVQQTAKDPFAYPLKWYGYILGISIFGGAVAWWRRVKRGEVATAHIRDLIGEIATSAFAGLLAFWVCESLGVPLIITAPIAGIAGHMGGRAIDLIETHLLKRAGFTPDRRATRPAPLDEGQP
jgi:hypothetical protein